MLVQGGWGAVVAPGHLGAVAVEEPQRRPGQRELAQGRRARRRPAALATASGPRCRPRRGCAPSPAGMPASASLASSGSASQVREGGLDHLDHALPVARPARGWWPCPRPPGRGRRPSQSRATDPRSRPRSARSRRGSGTGRRERSTGGGCPARGRPRRPRSSGCPGRRARRPRAASSDVRTTVPRPVRSPLVQRGEHAVRAVHPGEQVGDRDADPLRVLGPGAGQRHEAGLALGDLVVAGPATLRPVVAEAGDREHHQPRVEAVQRLDRRDRAGRGHRCGSSPRGRRRGRPGRSRVSVSAASLRSRVIDSLLRLQERKYVDSRASASVPTKGGPQPTGVVTVAGRLDLDDPGTEVAEHHRRVRPGQGPGEVDDDDVLQGSRHPGHQPGATSAAQTSSGPTRVTITA